MNKYFTYEELIEMIDSPNLESCKSIYADNKEIFDTARGSHYNHQTWIGGYKAHMTDVMNIAVLHYSTMNSLRELPFSLSDALLALFLHDIEKPWRHSGSDEHEAIFNSFATYQDFQDKHILDYKFELTSDHLNAVKYAHGEGDDYKNNERVSTPLAAFTHCCDTMSARIWFDHPKTHGW